MVATKRDKFGSLLVFFCFIVLGTNLAFGGVWYVDGEKKNSGGGRTWKTAVKTIQEAVDIATDGDEIWVKKGTYPLSATIEVDKLLRLYGGFRGNERRRNQRSWEENVTILDGQNSVSILKFDCSLFDLSKGSVIDGFTITRGYDLSAAGGLTLGLYRGQLMWVKNCIFKENNGGSGGAMTIWGATSDIMIENCTFSKNSAGSGGAIYSWMAVPNITKCIFSENQAAWNGGAVALDKNDWGSISDCIFYKNIAGGYGGGVELYFMDRYPAITNSTFIENTASYGGGISNWDSNGQIRNCIFSRNKANYGAGIYTRPESPGSPFHSTITNSTFSLNVASEYGGGIYDGYATGPAVPITNCILWNNFAPMGKEIYNEGTSSPVVTHSDIQGGHPGQENIDIDPLFADPVAGDFHLLLDSPCIDKGNPFAASIPLVDPEGNPRIMGLAPDMGAYEFGISLSIDIKPGRINPNSTGMISVTILSTEDLDSPGEIDQASLTFGHTGNERSLAYCDPDGKDVNGDSLKDLVCYSYPQDTGFQCGDTQGILKGETKNGTPLDGRDSVRIKHCKN